MLRADRQKWWSWKQERPMHGVLVEGLQINPGAMAHTRLQVLHREFLLLMWLKQ